MLVAVVELLAYTMPLAPNLVNSPVEGVALPIGALFNAATVRLTPLILPPVISASTVVIFVNTAVFGVAEPIGVSSILLIAILTPLILPPVIVTFGVAKFPINALDINALLTVIELP